MKKRNQKTGRRPGFADASGRFGFESPAAAGIFPRVAFRAWLQSTLPSSPAAVLAIGIEDSDVDWIASLGLYIVAVGRRERPASAQFGTVSWIDDRFPALEKVHRIGNSYDLIAVGPLWGSIPKEARPRAFRKLVTLLKAGGAIVFHLRASISKVTRSADTSPVELEVLARNHGAFIEHGIVDADERALLVRLPDDGTGALPLLRHIILNDDKSSTYKLALLRAICRIADGAAGCAWEREDGYVGVPLGLVGLYWIRLFKPLLAAQLPQSSNNKGLDGLGFVKDGFRRLADVSTMDLRIGVEFSGDTSIAMHRALRDACATIKNMPAFYIRYPNGKQVLLTSDGDVPRKGRAVRLDHAYLASFGEMRIPTHLWRALQRFDVWIEPALIAEWSRLIVRYADGQKRLIDEITIASAMTWSDPSRDVGFARAQATRLLEQGALFCVWTGKRLFGSTLDIDHCFPWSAWPCEDLWNLMPTDRRTNQEKKRHRLPSLELMRQSQDRIREWWSSGYINESPSLAHRFETQARASLPLVTPGTLDLNDLFAAMELRHMRLHLDQQIAIWHPRRSTAETSETDPSSSA